MANSPPYDAMSRDDSVVNDRGDSYGVQVMRVALDAGLRALSEDELFERLCAAIVQLPDVDVVWTGYVEETLIKKGPMAGFDDGYVSQLVVTADSESPYSQGPAGQSILTARPVVINAFLTASTTIPWHESASLAGFAAAAAFPVKIEREVVATLVAYSRRKGAFTDDVVSVLDGVREVGELALSRLRGANPDWLFKDLALVRDGALTALSQGIVVSDARSPDIPIIYCSPSFSQLTGYSSHEVLGRNCRFLQGPDSDQREVEKMRRAISDGVGVDVEVLNYRRDGSPFWNHVSITPIFDEHGSLIRFVGVQVDVTERKRLEAEIIRSQRFEAIGTLAGGVAHDFNNLLLVMNGYTDLLLRRLEDEDHRVIVQRVKDAVDRGAELTRHLLAYSRQQVRAPRSHDLSQLVASSESLVRGLVSEDISVTFDLADGLGPVLVDGAQIHQILINLVSNARNAMVGGGRLVVRTERIELQEPINQLHGRIEPGDYAVLEVADSGVGMDAETVSKMFEPFYTTRVLGTGLGLASVIGIVNQSGGRVAVTSRVGEGTSMRIFLPIVPWEERSESDATAPTFSDSLESTGKGETILVVEDDEQVRNLVASGLREYGYRVLVADGGPSALQIVNSESGSLDAVVTDVVMPEMNGRDLAETLWTVHQSLIVIFASGYDQGILDGVEDSARFSAFIEKPYALEDLNRALRSLLDGPRR